MSIDIAFYFCYNKDKKGGFDMVLIKNTPKCHYWIPEEDLDCILYDICIAYLYITIRRFFSNIVHLLKILMEFIPFVLDVQIIMTNILLCQENLFL